MGELTSRRAAVFLGDLRDPWARALAGTLPTECLIFDIREGWPDRLPGETPQERTAVVHRSYLSAGDHEWLARGRRAGFFRRILLCVGPLVRHHQLERLNGLVEVILPETTAVEVIDRYLDPVESKIRERSDKRSLPRVWVASGLAEVRAMLVQACESAGYLTATEAVLGQAGGEGLTVWDVPLLDPAWPAALQRVDGWRQVVCIGGFTDRGLVRRLRGLGTAACLDWPCDPRDMIHVLDRLVAAASRVNTNIRKGLPEPHFRRRRHGRSTDPFLQ